MARQTKSQEPAPVEVDPAEELALVEQELAGLPDLAAQALGDEDEDTLVRVSARRAILEARTVKLRRAVIVRDLAHVADGLEEAHAEKRQVDANHDKAAKEAALWAQREREHAGRSSALQGHIFSILDRKIALEQQLAAFDQQQSTEPTGPITSRRWFGR